MKLEINTFYKTRDGRKARVICVDAKSQNGMYPIVALIESAGDETSYHYATSGAYCHFWKEHILDLLTEWTEPPTFDWSKLPAWATHAAQDDEGGWYWYDRKPTLSDGGWYNEGEECGEIPKRYAPKNYTGPWQESLLVREGNR